MIHGKLSAFPLRSGRVHEVSGAAARSFAAICAAQLSGPVLWLCESWRPEAVHPEGMAAFFDPARMLMGHCPGQSDLLAVAEEALRDGGVPLVIVEISAPLGLTAGRRLQLAAGAGASTGLCLISEGHGSNAAETRWRAGPGFDVSAGARGALLYHWDLVKNKSGTLGAWDVRWDGAARRVLVARRRLVLA